MATINSNDSTITSDALAMLEFCADGLDEVIYNIAEQVAASRNPEKVEIGVPDITTAVTILAEALLNSDLPPHVRTAVKEMLASLSKRR